MNKYQVQHKVRTLSNMSVGLKNMKPDSSPLSTEIEGFNIAQWDFSIRHGLGGDGWMVSKIIEAESALKAVLEFRNDLDKIIPKLAFISQCYMEFYRQSFLVLKCNDNPSNIFWLRFTEQRNGVPLSFTDLDLENYKKIKDFKYQQAFVYLQECNNCSGYIPKLMLLFATLESMCGEVEKRTDQGEAYFTYDKDVMRLILGDELYDKLFGKDGIRHKLDHGGMMNFGFAEAEKDLVEVLHKKIVDYFSNLYKIKFAEVRRPQRHFNDNWYHRDAMLEPEDGFKIDLKNCIDNYSVDGMYPKVKGCQLIATPPSEY